MRLVNVTKKHDKLITNFELTIVEKHDIIIKLSDERSGTEKEIGNGFGLRKVKFAEIFDYLKKST